MLSVMLSLSLLAAMTSSVSTVGAAENELYTYYDFGITYPVYAYGDTTLLDGQNADNIYNGNCDANAAGVGLIAEFALPSKDYVKSAVFSVMPKTIWGHNTNTVGIYPFFSGWDEESATFNSMIEMNSYTLELYNGIKDGTAQAVVAPAEYDIVAETYLDFDITDYVKTLESNDFGLLVDLKEASSLYQKDGNRGRYGKAPKIYISYDIDALLADINSAQTEGEIENIISQNGQLIGIYADAYNRLTDKSSVNAALLNKSFTQAIEATNAANNAIDALMYYVNDIPVISSHTGTIWTMEAGDYYLSSNTPSLTTDYSSYPQNYRAAAKLYINPNSGRNAPPIDRTQQILDFNSKKTIGYINAQGANNYYGGAFPAEDNLKVTFIAIDKNECISNIQKSYINLGYDKTAILADINDAQDIDTVENILKNYGYMLDAEITNDNAGNVAVAFFYTDMITLENISEIIANTDSIVAENLIPAINDCKTAEEFEAAVIRFGKIIGIDLTLFNRLSNSDDIFPTMFAQKPENGFTDTEEIKDKFNALISAKINTAPMRVIAYEDYNISSDSAINNMSNWAEGLLLKYKIGNAVNTTSKHIVKIEAIQKMGQHSQLETKEREYMLYEVSPEGWTDLPATPQDTMKTLDAYKDTSKLVAQGKSVIGNNSIVTLDVTDYFLDSDNRFIKNPNEDFALKFKCKSSAFFATADASNSSYVHYIEFTYDTEAILEEINSATKDNIEDIITREGSVIGIKVSAYNNLKYKDTVNNAMVGKNFANVAEAATAANDAIDSMLYSETVTMKNTGWGTLKISDNSNVTANPVDFWLSYGNDYINYFTYDMSGMTYNKADSVYSEMILNTRNLNEDTEIRYLQFLDAPRYGNIMGIGSNPAIGKGDIKGDITSAVKNASGDTVTVYSTAPIVRGGKALLSTPIFNLNSGAEYASGRFFINVYYDKLDVANKIASSDDIYSANNLFAQYCEILGLEGITDFSKYSTLFMGKTITSVEQMNELIEKAEAVTVAVTNLNAGNITAGMTTTSGSITLANFTGKYAKIAVVVASYDANGVMVDAIVVDTDNGEGDTRLPKNGGTYTFNNLNITNAKEIRAFTWDGFETMNPYDVQTVYTINR